MEQLISTEEDVRVSNSILSNYMFYKKVFETSHETSDLEKERTW